MIDFEHIPADLNDEEILMMMAEQASGLVQAALKLRRNITQRSSCRAYRSARFDFLCGLVDILTCWELISPDTKDDGNLDGETFIRVMREANLRQIKGKTAETETEMIKRGILDGEESNDDRL